MKSAPNCFGVWHRDQHENDDKDDNDDDNDDNDNDNEEDDKGEDDKDEDDDDKDDNNEDDNEDEDEDKEDKEIKGAAHACPHAHPTAGNDSDTEMYVKNQIIDSFLTRHTELSFKVPLEPLEECSEVRQVVIGSTWVMSVSVWCFCCALTYNLNVDDYAPQIDEASEIGRVEVHTDRRQDTAPLSFYHDIDRPLPIVLEELGMLHSPIRSEWCIIYARNRADSGLDTNSHIYVYKDDAWAMKGCFSSALNLYEQLP